METLISLLIDKTKQFPDRVAIREKKFGIWKPLTWEQLYKNVKYFSLGLKSLGMLKGNKINIIGDNCSEWIIAELGAVGCGGSFVGIYQDMLPEEVAYVASASDARFMVAQDQEQVDKILEIWERISKTVERIVVWDSRGMGHYFSRHNFLIHFDDVLKQGEKMEREFPGIFEKGLAEIHPDDTAMLLTTSGTTAMPKLAMLSHHNFTSAVKSWETDLPTVLSDEMFSLLPMAWAGEQFNVVRFLYRGFHYNFPESSQTVRNDLVQLQPTVIGMPPRMWEDICSNIMAKMEEASYLKKLFYKWALAVGQEKANMYLEGKGSLPFFKEMLYQVHYFFTLRAMKTRVGLGRIRMAITGGAAIGREVFTFFTALGIKLMQMYGMTETAVVASAHRHEDIRPETVGTPLPNVEIRVDEDGGIWIRGENIMSGYYNKPAETKEVIVDGWFKTGDAGYFDEFGHLVVLDRQRDMMNLNNGTKFAPQDLENRLKFSPYIRDAVIIGDKRDCISALISIDMANVGNWAQRRNLAYTTFGDLSQNPKVNELIRQEVIRVNERLPENMRIAKFALLPKELHPDDEELTRTRKVKRGVINERYGSLIEAMYTKCEFQPLDIIIKYMDGRQSHLKSNVKIVKLLQ